MINVFISILTVSTSFPQITAAFLQHTMGVASGMAHAWLRVIREGHKAKQTMGHLSKRRWKHLGKRLHQKGRGFKIQQGAGFGIPLAMLASWGIKKIVKKIQGGSGIRRKNKSRKRQTRTLLLQ